MRTVLVYRLGSLGDTLVALPALRLVAAAYPGCRLVAVTNEDAGGHIASMEAVLSSTGLIDSYIKYPLGLRRLRDLLALRARIRAEGADELVYLASPRGRLTLLRDLPFFGACGIRRFVGLPWRADMQAPRAIGGGRVEREGERLLRCVQRLARDNADTVQSWRLDPGPAIAASAAGLLATLGERPLIAFSVGTKVPANDWEDARWAPMLAELARRYPRHGLVALGGAPERARIDALLQPWDGRALNLAGRLTVTESVAVLSRCAVFIGHDSGPMHLAAAAGTRCVAIFSSRLYPGYWFPFGGGHEVLYREIDCQGCALSVCEARAKACIRSISVDDVVQAVGRVLAREQEQGVAP